MSTNEVTARVQLTTEDRFVVREIAAYVRAEALETKYSASGIGPDDAVRYVGAYRVLLRAADSGLLALDGATGHAVTAFIAEHRAGALACVRDSRASDPGMDELLDEIAACDRILGTQEVAHAA